MANVIYQNITAEGAKRNPFDLGTNPWAQLTYARQNQVVLQSEVDAIEMFELGAERKRCAVIFFIAEDGTVIRGILPQEESGARTIGEMEKRLLGQQVAFVVTQVMREAEAVMLSRTRALEIMRTRNSQNIKVGERWTGVVKFVRQFRAYIDIGGIMATLPSREMSWNYVEDARELLQRGDEIEVVVKRTSVGENGMVRLIECSLRPLQHDPWANVPLKEKQTYVGVVTGAADTGHFILFNNGVQGMCQFPNDGVLTNGTKVAYEIQRIESKTRRIWGAIKRVIA